VCSKELGGYEDPQRNLIAHTKADMFLRETKTLDFMSSVFFFLLELTWTNKLFLHIYFNLSYGNFIGHTTCVVFCLELNVSVSISLICESLWI